jgi:hypothetical protein
MRWFSKHKTTTTPATPRGRCPYCNDLGQESVVRLWGEPWYVRDDPDAEGDWYNVFWTEDGTKHSRSLGVMRNGYSCTSGHDWIEGQQHQPDGCSTVHYREPATKLLVAARKPRV